MDTPRSPLWLFLALVLPDLYDHILETTPRAGPTHNGAFPKFSWMLKDGRQTQTEHLILRTHFKDPRSSPLSSARPEPLTRNRHAPTLLDSRTRRSLPLNTLTRVLGSKATRGRPACAGMKSQKLKVRRFAPGF